MRAYVCPRKIVRGTECTQIASAMPAARYAESEYEGPSPSRTLGSTSESLKAKKKTLHQRPAPF